MNIHKHMEAIFVVTLVAATAGTFAFDSMREPEAPRSASVASDEAARDARSSSCAPTMFPRA